MLRRIKQNIIINVHRSSLEVRVILVRFYSSFDSVDGFSEIPSNINFHEYSPSGSRVFPCGRDEANSHFASILRTGLKIRHPLSFNWPVSEGRDFSTNWTTADETLCLPPTPTHFYLWETLRISTFSGLHELPLAYSLLRNFYKPRNVWHIQWQCLKFMDRHTHTYIH